MFRHARGSLVLINIFHGEIITLKLHTKFIKLFISCIITLIVCENYLSSTVRKNHG